MVPAMQWYELLSIVCHRPDAHISTSEESTPLRQDPSHCSGHGLKEWKIALEVMVMTLRYRQATVCGACIMLKPKERNGQSGKGIIISTVSFTGMAHVGEGGARATESKNAQNCTIYLSSILVRHVDSP